MGKAEILAPCGSPQSLEAALRTGCDAVYLGGEMFSARQNAANFSKEELKKAVYDCHVRGVKVYQAINTVITDRQLDYCLQAVRFACETGIDGLITQDLALVEIVKSCCPELEIHASTQMTLHTQRGVLFAKAMGFSRAVVSRELPYDIIKELCRLPVEIEVFVHGALCMSVSGQCYMSAVIGSRSANRGLCAQACRLPVSAQKQSGKERHDLSLKDMSYISHIKELEGCGAASLKIEGRMKRPEYVAAAVDSVRNARDGGSFDVSLLEKVFSRSGFTDGYYLRRTGSEMFGFRQKEDVVSSAEALPKIHELYRREYKRSGIYIYVRMKKDERIFVSASDENGATAEVTGDVPQQAIQKATDGPTLEKQFSKLGETIYTLSGFSADIDEGLCCPASALNALRRELCSRLDEKRYEFYTKTADFTAVDLKIAKPKPCAEPKIRISVTSAEQLSQVDIGRTELAVCPLQEAKKLLEAGFSANKLAAEMPRFTFDEKKDFSALKELKENGLRHMVCTNYAHISMGKELGLIMHGGFGLNVTNSLALRSLKKLGLSDCTASFELKSGQINALGGELEYGVIGYGRLPLMLTVNCPVKQACGCGKCSGAVKDRTGRAFPIKCSKAQGYVEILNSEPLYMADRLSQFNTASFVQLDFFDESPRRVCEIISAFEKGLPPSNESITRGLYNRGVL